MWSFPLIFKLATALIPPSSDRPFHEPMYVVDRGNFMPCPRHDTHHTILNVFQESLPSTKQSTDRSTSCARPWWWWVTNASYNFTRVTTFLMVWQQYVYMLCERPPCIRCILGHLRALKYEVSVKYHSHKFRTDRRYSDHTHHQSVMSCS